MSPEKTHPDGWYRLDRHVEGVGRIRRKSGRTLTMHRRVDAVVTKFAEAGRLEELRALRIGAITSMMLIDADRRNAKATDPSAALLAAPLFPASDRHFAGAGPTQVRYRGSIKRLKVDRILGDDATISDLAAIDYPAMNDAWETSDADWNHMRRAISRLLTLQLGEHHPFRVELLKGYPKRKETERLVELSPAEFEAIIGKADVPLQHCFWTLAVTGLRSIAEYRRLTRASLGHFTVTVRKSKNDASPRVIPVDRRFWHHVTAAVPCPVKPDYLTRAWRVLADAAGRPDLVLRDLRHCYGFWSLEAGVEINVVRDAMGHATLATTQKYVKQRAKAEHASALASLITRGRKKGSKTA